MEEKLLIDSRNFRNRCFTFSEVTNNGKWSPQSKFHCFTVSVDFFTLNLTKEDYGSILIFVNNNQSSTIEPISYDQPILEEVIVDSVVQHRLVFVPVEVSFEKRNPIAIFTLTHGVLDIIDENLISRGTNFKLESTATFIFNGSKLIRTN